MKAPKKSNNDFRVCEISYTDKGKKHYVICETKAQLDLTLTKVRKITKNFSIQFLNL